MALYIYNTQARKKEKFEPIRTGKVGIYVCGVTVYDEAHIGHARSAVVFDAIIRYLRYKGFSVNHVTNFTDVDDKIIARARELNMKPLELSKKYIDEFFDDMDRLRVTRANHYPKASETIPDIIEMIERLIANGHAYAVNGDVYFDITKVKEYGRLSGQSLENIQAGARIEAEENKHNQADFALWKSAKEGEISWPSPWGAGRPGWHIECSAMALKFIGETIDIHGGGNELIFPHHENEIQQSESVTGKQFAKYWMHNGLLMINEEKMSKSLKNFFTIGDVLSAYDTSTIRFFLLNANYRQPLDYDENSLENAKRSLERLQNTYSELLAARGKMRGSDDAKEISQEALSEFEGKMDDDFNMREALAAIFSLAREANRLMAEKKLSDRGVENILSTLKAFDSIFDILRREEKGLEEQASKLIELILRARESARKRGDYAAADALRTGLKELGITIEDSVEGPKWKIRK